MRHLAAGIFSIVVTLCFPILSFAEWIVVGDGSSGIDVKSFYDRIEVEVRFGGVEIAEKTEFGQTFDTVEIPTISKTDEPGKPELPRLIKLLSVPDNVDFTLTITESEFSSINEITVYPVQEPIPTTAERTSLTIDAGFYSADIYYPADIVDLKKPIYMRYQRILPIEVNPFHYNPATGNLKVYHRIKFTISFDQGRNAGRIAQSPVGSNISFKNLFKNALANYPSYVDDASGEDPLLIVCADTLCDQGEGKPLKRLVDHKVGMGQTVSVVNLTDINGNTNTGLKQYFQEQYDAGTLADFVLLVGAVPVIEDSGITPSAFKNRHVLEQVGTGTSLIPTNVTDLTVEDISCEEHEEFSNKSLCFTVSDFEYTLLERDGEKDIFGDFFLGRVTVRTETELGYVVDKIITYENASFQNWMSEAQIISGNIYSYDNFETIAESIYFNPIVDYLGEEDVTKDFLSESKD
ncbi:MAG TPA: C25 family peptidase propeptide domain-containing protein, partial [bacterium]|nr:C25 family peptidase propeptide domain-containing protein [bacterium]